MYIEKIEHGGDGMNANEKIISKVRKVLELSKNNPSEEEAKSAELMAQRLMAEYHLELADIEDINDDEEPFEIQVNCGKGNKWKYALAGIVAKNFMCKHFYYGKETVVFYGYQVDAETAAMTFKFLFDFGNKKANSFYQSKRNAAMKKYGCFEGDGLKNSYLIGYLEGIMEVLERQCTALMLVTPPAIEAAYKERISGAKTSNHSALRCRAGGSGDSAREEGRRVGKSVASSRNIEAKG